MKRAQRARAYQRNFTPNWICRGYFDCGARTVALMMDPKLGLVGSLSNRAVLMKNIDCAGVAPGRPRRSQPHPRMGRPLSFICCALTGTSERTTAAMRIRVSRGISEAVSRRRAEHPNDEHTHPDRRVAIPPSSWGSLN